MTSEYDYTYYIAIIIAIIIIAMIVFSPFIP